MVFDILLCMLVSNIVLISLCLLCWTTVIFIVFFFGLFGRLWKLGFTSSHREIVSSRSARWRYDSYHYKKTVFQVLNFMHRHVLEPKTEDDMALNVVSLLWQCVLTVIYNFFSVDFGPRNRTLLDRTRREKHGLWKII